MSSAPMGVFYQAHRGAVDEAPENTLPAFRHAWRYPGAIPETDVRVTADGALVCVHDATLARTTDAPATVAARSVAEMTLAEIQAVDAGVRFGASFQGQRVPTLDELLAEMVQQPGRRLFVEPKAVDLQVLRAKLDEYAVTEQVIFVSGHPAILAEIQRVLPGAPAMTWVGGTPEDIRAGVARQLEAGAPHLSHLQLHLPVAKARSESGPEPVYALEDEYLAETQRRLHALGVEMQLRPFAVTEGALRRFVRMGVRWFVTDGPAAFWRTLAAALLPDGAGEEPEPIYHITPLRDWYAALAAGEYRAASLAAEGFIHCSTRGQVLRAANRSFPADDELVILCVDPQAVQTMLRFEAPAHAHDPLAQEVFPHVYGALPLGAVVAIADLRRGVHGDFVWPEMLP
ncbi:MAG: DUF952 domain-containing protein [Caldilineaceae bacterium]|nr:DUF952 domain-containing protein [Caldilineaceae bacterium]